MKQFQNKQRTKKRKKRNPVAEAILQAANFFSYKNATVVGGKYRAGVTVSEIVKYCIYAVMGVFLILLQLTFFSTVRPFNSTPDILIIATAAVSMFEGERAGAVFGLSVGFVAEALGSVGVSLLPLIYMLFGYVCGIVASEYYRRSVLLFLIFDASACAVRFFTTLIYIVITWKTVDLSIVIPDVLFPEFFSTFAISPVPTLFMLPIYRIFHGNEKQKPGLE